jgi:hypothetical protein
MDFFKKHPFFCALLSVSILIFAFGIYLFLGARAADDRAARKLQAIQQNLQSVARGEIAPTVENLEQAEFNVIALRNDLERIRERLESGVYLQPTEDPVQLITRIQRFISQMRRATEAVSIKIPENFGFGFDRYVEQSTPPEQAVVARVDKQRLILEYLLGELIASEPRGIIRVQRETIESAQTAATTATATARPTSGSATRAASARTTSAAGDSFNIDPAISARVPDAIDTLAFRITFTGFTQSLQTYINRLALFEYPIVVRSIEVARPAPAQNTRAPRTQTIDDIFSGFGGGTAQTPQAEEPRQRPVIEDNESEFTLVLEFIELILPQR